MARFRIKFCICAGDGADLYLARAIVAAIGLPFQVALQHPYVMIGLSIIFVVSVIDVRCIHFTASKAPYKQNCLYLANSKKRSPLVEVLNGDDYWACGSALSTSAPLLAPYFTWRRVEIYLLVRSRFFARVGYGRPSDFNHFIWE